MQLQEIIAQHINGATVTATGGAGKFEVTVISDTFSDLTPIKRHQAVYAAVNSYIADGTLHALSINAYTIAEFNRQAE